MKTLLALFAAVIAAPFLAAQPLNQATLARYVEHAFPQCPASAIKIEPITQTGPAGFDTFKVSQKSSDEYCAAQKYLLVSPKSQQTILGTIIRLPEDTRPIQIRVAEHASNILKANMTARVAPIALPDGLKAVTISRETPFGQFGYDGYVDASEVFLLVGMRGSLTGLIALIALPPLIVLVALTATAGVTSGLSRSSTEKPMPVYQRAMTPSIARPL